MEKQYFNGYFCKKCNSIPLIQIIPKEKNSKILSSCKCCKHYHTIDNFIKYFYHKDIDINRITNNLYNQYYENNEEININLIADKLKKTRIKLEIETNKIKNKIIELFQRKIDEIQELYKSYIANNNKIIMVLEEIIKSYQSIKDNQSNILNIFNNFSFNDFKIDDTFNVNDSLDKIFNKVKNYFDNEFIIQYSNLMQKGENKSIVLTNSYNITCFLELDNSICASCSNSRDSILLYDLNNLNGKNISFKAHSKSVNWIIKSNKNNIISCGNDGLIKIWPVITDIYIKQQKKLYSLSNNMDNIYYNNFNQMISINLIPLFEFKLDNSQWIQMIKMIHLKEDKFLLFTKEDIFIFKYIIDEDKTKIDLIGNYIVNNLIDSIIIQKENDEIIAAYNNKFLFFLNIPDLKFINKINIRLRACNSLMQLNSTDLLLFDRFSFKILDINTFKIKIIIKYSYNTEFLLNLNDGTIIQGTFYGIKRLLIRTMEELPDLIKYEKDEKVLSNEFDDDYNNNNERIVYMFKLKDGKFILCRANEKIEIYNIKFI